MFPPVIVGSTRTIMSRAQMQDPEKLKAVDVKDQLADDVDELDTETGVDRAYELKCALGA